MNKLTRRSAIFYLVLVFIAGMIAGGAGRYYYAKKAGFRPPPPPRGSFEEFIMGKLTEELNLTTNQAALIAPIVRTNFATMDVIRKETEERMNEVFTRMNEEMGLHLTEEQKAKLAEMEKGRREFSRGHGHGPRPGREKKGGRD